MLLWGMDSLDETFEKDWQEDEEEEEDLIRAAPLHVMIKPDYEVTEREKVGGFSSMQLIRLMNNVSFDSAQRLDAHVPTGLFPLDRYASFERRAIKSLDLSHSFSAVDVARFNGWLKDAAQHLTTLRLRCALLCNKIVFVCVCVRARVCVCVYVCDCRCLCL